MCCTVDRAGENWGGDVWQGLQGQGHQHRQTGGSKEDAPGGGRWALGLYLEPAGAFSGVRNSSRRSLGCGPPPYFPGRRGYQTCCSCSVAARGAVGDRGGDGGGAAGGKVDGWLVDSPCLLLRALLYAQMEEEGVPSTTLREVSLLLMLSESNHVVK